MKKKVKKIINAIIDVIVVLILIVSILVVVLSLTSKSQGVPNLFGYAPMSVESDSMEPTLMVGDLIFCEVTNDGNYEYEIGDVVTFPIEIDGVKTYNTHRIVAIDDEGPFEIYQTQGDNEEKPDEKWQDSGTIVAKYTGNKVSGLGHLVGFIRTQLGFFLCVLLPMIIFFVYEAIRVILNLLAYNKEKTLAEAQAAVQNAELTEEQKQRAIEEYLRSLGQNSDKGSQPDVQTPASVDESKLDE